MTATRSFRSCAAPVTLSSESFRSASRTVSGWCSRTPAWGTMVTSHRVGSWSHIAFCDRCIMDGKVGRLSINSWKSHRLRRAVKASLGSEALALDDGLAELEWIKALFCESVVPGTCVSDGTRYGDDETIAVARMADDGDPTLGITDARALYDLFQRRSGAAGLCRRAQLDVAVMSKSAEVLRTKLFWIPGANMPSDCLAKRLGNATLM